MGIDKDRNLSSAEELRRLAEKQLSSRSPEVQLPQTDHELQRLVHELQVHQVELELQNAELRQARDEVESVVEKYTDLYDFAPVGYFTLDNKGIIRTANLSGSALLGVERSLLVGSCFGDFVPRNDRYRFSDFLLNVFKDQGRTSCDLALMTERNFSIYVEIDAVADSSGNECRVAVIDITRRRSAEFELKLAQQELQTINSSLEQRISETLAEMRRKDQVMILQDRLSVMGEMINNIAHQWRQPLNTLGLLVQKLQLFFGSADFDRKFLEDTTANAMKQIRHMSHTIDAFSNFFRSDKKKIMFDVSQVIGNTIALIDKTFKDLNISIDFRTLDNPVIHGYPNEFSQVILNILMNARDALAGNHLDEAIVYINAFTENGKTVVTITDNAGGIDSSVIGRLFEPYFSTKGPDKGTGIGLYMSKTIIETNMGGSLTVCNTGDGAEFRIEVENAES